ncbi:efflux RND transporter periplasmic adaptor subunit [Shewanella sp. SNU WT4]|uniref:efflux RND transporter periplasmic adaptor subunit n=1 Tax=Shewanella sp. SNU WT4 TaxID=2590015 RepID=UPI00112AC8B2|nr:efflux RND transporter periplasmic adaptor subunit [Shewanella sp. SNU WT4]QDF65341.1 efflux RND transporter periplasmic adaptor subunit [Shewanella sp. SNU WT4]
MRHMLKIVSVITAALWITACNSEAEGPKANAGPQGVPVNVVKVTTQAQDIMMELPGRSRAFMQAEVRPQVSGIIEARSFVEGGLVTVGQSLYQIDPSTYEAALVSAKADLARAEAMEVSTKATAARFQKLVKTNAISDQDFDQAKASYLEAKASVAIANAAINNAEINLAYTKMAAPISGRIGKSNVTPGALVTANQSQALAQISQLDPINVDIVQSSTQMLRLNSRIASGQLLQPETTAVRLVLEDGTPYPHQGKLQFSEVTVDENTGSVSMRAEFPNPDGILLPGMFVRTTMTVGNDPKAILVPQKGVTRNPKGQGLAMVVGADNKVEARIVTTAEVINNQWLVTSGLQDGDLVIVEGLQKVRPGATAIPQIVSNTADK